MCWVPAGIMDVLFGRTLHVHALFLIANPPSTPCSYAQARKRLLSNRKTPFWMFFEAVQCAIMVAAMVMLMIYVYRMNISARLSSS
jgi:hypothetical protein